MSKLDSVRELLGSSDDATFEQGVALLCALEDPGAITQVLDQSEDLLSDYWRAVILGRTLALSPALAARVAAQTDLKLSHDGPVDLDAIAKLPLQSLELWTRSTVALGALRSHSSLKRLVISAEAITELDVVHTLALEALSLRSKQDFSLEPMRGQTTITELSLHGNVEHPEALAELPRLETLDFGWSIPVDVTALDGSETLQALKGNVARLPKRMPALRTLFVSKLEQWSGFPETPLLRELSLSDVPDLVDLSGLTRAAPKLESAAFSKCPALATLDGAQDHPTLQRVRVSPTRALKSLGTLPERVQLDLMRLDESGILDLHGAEKLKSKGELDCPPTIESLDGIEGLPVVVLRLGKCKALKDVSAVAKCAETIRVILVRDSSVNKAMFPESVRWAVSVARNPNVYELAKRTPPEPKTKKSSGAKKTKLSPEGEAFVAEVRGEMDSADPEAAAKAIAAVAERGEVAVYDALLKGVKYSTREASINTPGFRTKDRREFVRACFFRLIGEAPDECKASARLRKKIERLEFQGLGRSDDLDCLARFTSLKELRCSLTKHAKRGWAPESLRTLKAAVTRDHTDWLDGKITHLYLTGIYIVPNPKPVVDLTPLASTLELLHVGSVEFDVATLTELNALRELSLYGGSLAATPWRDVGVHTLTLDLVADVDYAELAKAPELRVLRVNVWDAERLGDIGPLRESKLNVLDTHNREPIDFTPLEGLKLERLNTHPESIIPEGLAREVTHDELDVRQSG